MFLEKLVNLRKQASLKISIVGGSNSVMREGYSKYLNNYLHQATSQETSIKYYSLGGVSNIFGLIQQDRYNIARNSDIIFFEYCVNDRHAIEVDCYSLELAGKSLEGFIRKCQKANPFCLIVLIIFGVNKEDYYQTTCALSELYQSIGEHYRLPVINLTNLLNEQKGQGFVKSLYGDKDVAHYTRPFGVKIVAQTIVEQLDKIGVIRSLNSTKNFSENLGIKPIYQDNFENLAFFEHFEQGKFFDHHPRISVYQNTVYREKIFTLTQGNSLKFWLKGKLAALYIKSDLNDGLIEINFAEQRLVTSTYSEWVNNIKPQNVINLVTLPLSKFSESQDFAPVLIACCQEYSDNCELDYIKIIPKKKDPQKWKLNIIGIAYVGEIKPWQS
jgi:hypothetical protein